MPTYRFDDYRRALGDRWFEDDPDLHRILRHRGVGDERTWARLDAYGAFAASAASDGADAADRPDALPRLVPYDAWGRPNPIQVEVHPATRRVLAAALRAGAATDTNEVLRYGLAYLGAQVGEAGVTCPLACTDGLVRALQELDGGEAGRAALEHILTQAPGGPVHAAQFVTEIQGGSDAGTNEVVAEDAGDGTFRLTGQKWFCSNAWAQYWAVTARPAGAASGPRGVGLFLVSREREGLANGFRLDRLKDKLGTRALPTAEMTLMGATATPIGRLDQGLSNMVRIVLSTSRVWNVVAAASFVRGAERIATAYAGFRQAFGGPISRFALVEDGIAQLTLDRRRLTAAAFEVLAAWQACSGPERRGERPTADALFRCRVLVMLAKACATRLATERVHDAMMILAGNGIEERFSALPRLWRDAAIIETWEGPHGLLLERSLAELQRGGAADDPVAATRLLLGGVSDEGAAVELGEDLRRVLGAPEGRARAVVFRAWAERFYSTLGDLAWAQAEAHQ